jgi:maltoporin
MFSAAAAVALVFARVASAGTPARVGQATSREAASAGTPARVGQATSREAASAQPPPPAPSSSGAAATEPPAAEPSVSSEANGPSAPAAADAAHGQDVTRGNDGTRTVKELPLPSGHEGHFEFGSYGRVYAASDLRGEIGRATNVVAFGPRIVNEGSYAELELRREDRYSDRVKTRVVATLALFPPFFHFTGQATQNIGLRNLYAQGTYDSLTMWAGSRMYRGDDIYLLNWWPLDNQNTIGGGIGGPVFRLADGSQETVLQAHVGQQRLDNPFQFQEIPVVAPYGFGTVNVTKLDRPRTIETFKATHFVRPGRGPAGFKVVLYGELHELSAGVYQDPLTKVDRGLPSDSGFMLGSQLTYFTGKHDMYASVVMRHARGIAAYDPLSAPTTFAVDHTVQGASETQAALSGNFENEFVGVLGAAYVRFFRDASPAESSTQKYDEGAVVVRPSVFLGDYFGVSFEGSYQQRRIAIQSPDHDGPLTASIVQAGVIPYFSPAGRGSFTRPQLRLLYVASFRDSGARSLYPVEDVFSQRHVEHFLGIGAEWWFNSSSYP